MCALTLVESRGHHGKRLFLYAVLLNVGIPVKKVHISETMIYINQFSSIFKIQLSKYNVLSERVLLKKLSNQYQTVNVLN